MSSFDFSQFQNSGVTNPVPSKRPGVDAESWTVPAQPQATALPDMPNQWSGESITYVSITQDRLDNNRRNFPVILPFVDRAVVVDGFSKDGTTEYLASLGNKVTVVQREWDDSFANQYNEYLRHIRGGWVLILDDDELPSEQMLSSLRDVVQKSENGTKFDTVEFKANDISYVVGDWANRTDNGPCEYFRQMFYKWNPNIHYKIDLHQALMGLKGPVARVEAHYYHIKSTRDEYRNACRNYFISGEWPPTPVVEGYKTPEWHELKKILAENHPEVKVFGHFNGLLVSKTACPEAIAWIFKYRNHKKGEEGETSGELRAWAGYLDILGYEE